MSTPTLRRLDDRERYWALTWPGWIAAIGGAGALYLAIKLSPLSTKPTITITLFVLAFVGMILYGVSGQALSPGRQLLAIISYRRSVKLLELSDRAERRGLVLDTRPPPLDAEPAEMQPVDVGDPDHEDLVDRQRRDEQRVRADASRELADEDQLSPFDELAAEDPLAAARDEATTFHAEPSPIGYAREFEPDPDGGGVEGWGP